MFELSLSGGRYCPSLLNPHWYLPAVVNAALFRRGSALRLGGLFFHFMVHFRCFRLIYVGLVFLGDFGFPSGSSVKILVVCLLVSFPSVVCFFIVFLWVYFKLPFDVVTAYLDGWAWLVHVQHDEAFAPSIPVFAAWNPELRELISFGSIVCSVSRTHLHSPRANDPRSFCGLWSYCSCSTLRRKQEECEWFLLAKHPGKHHTFPGSGSPPGLSGNVDNNCFEVTWP